jgi:hypothetical protein
MLWKPPNLAESLTAKRTQHEATPENLKIKVEEEETNRFPERQRGNDQHQSAHTKRRKTDEERSESRDYTGDQHGGNYMPLS